MRTCMGIVIGMLCVACGSSGESPSPSPSPSPAPSPSPSPSPARSPSPAPSPSPSPSPAPAIAEADVRAIVDAWAAAQNAADFAAYDALYASRFDGIRRSGPRVRRFDRDGWMADRRGMFARPMHVEVRELTVTVAGTTATAHFTQSFTEGTFHDEGPKELTVVTSAAGLRIAREEMLASTLGGAGPPPTLAPGALLPIVSAGDARFAVLAVVPEGAAWDEGAPTLLEQEGVVVTRASARAGAVPAPLAALASAAVGIDDAQGGHCDGTLGPLAVLSRVDVHFGTEAIWRGENEDGTQGTPWTPAQIAASAWGEGMLLVAPIAASGCAGASSARLASLPPAPAFVETAADDALAARVRTAFRALDVWTTTEAAYHDAGGAEGHWDEIPSASSTVGVWSAPGSTRRFAVLNVSAGDGGCADFAASYWSVFEVGAEGALTRLTDASNPLSFVPQGARDVDGDGRPEWIVEQGIVGAVGSGLGLVLDISAPVHDCYC